MLFKLMLLFVIVTSFTAVAMAARRGDERVNIADFASDPDSFAGRTVEVEARVVAINADGRTLELFDSPSHTRISVQLAQLPKSERLALIRSNVRELLVRGRAAVIAGRLTINANSVQWAAAEAK
jgi:hypothetical protein